MPGITYKDGGTDRAIANVYYQDGATLRTITEVWIGDGGANRKVFPSAASGAVLFDDVASSVGIGGRTAGIRVNASGIQERLIQAAYTTVGTWLLSGAAADYEVRLDVVSGPTPSGSAVGTWLGAGTSREWTNFDGSSGDGGVLTTATLSVRDVATATLIDTAALTIEAERP